MTTTQYLELKNIFSIAYHNYEKDLKARAYFKLSNPMLGEDVVQNTFMKTWSYLIKGGKIDKMKAFLYKILDNLIVDEYRRRKMNSLDAMLEKGFDPGDSSSSSESVADAIDQRKILSFVKSLPEKYERVISMYYIEELSLEEMSAILGHSKNTISVQIHRGLEKLKVLYPPL